MFLCDSFVNFINDFFLLIYIDDCLLFCRDSIMSEEKQRIILLERVNAPSFCCFSQLFLVFLTRLTFVTDFTYEGRRKQAPQSETRESIPFRYVESSPLGGSSIKEDAF